MSRLTTIGSWPLRMTTHISCSSGRAFISWWGTQGGTRPMTLGFNVYRPFTLNFVRPVSQLDPKAGSKPIDPSQIATVVVKGVGTAGDGPGSTG